MIHLFLNTDEYLTAERIAEFKARLGDPELAGLNVVELSAGLADPAAIVAAASLMPFLAEKRLVIVRGYLDALDKRMAASKSAESAAHHEAAQLLDCLPAVPETCDLLFVDNTVDKRRALWKGFAIPAQNEQPARKIPGLEATANSGMVQLEELATPDPKRLPVWIQQRARAQKIAIGGDAVAVLANFVGPNLRQLDNEMEKLSLFAYQRTITAQDVRAMVSDVSEEMIWNLTDGLCQRNPRPAMAALRDLRSRDQSPIGLLTSIARQYRLIIQVKTAMQGSGDENTIAKRLGEKPFPVKKAMQLAGRYSFAELEQILDRLLVADMAMKTGADQDTELDVLVAELSQKGRPETGDRVTSPDL